MPTFGELLNRSFEKASFGGYKASDVDSFMEELASKVTQSDRETDELKRKLGAAEIRIKDFENEEESLKSTLLSAQKLADSIVKEANEKAQLTLKDAEIKAQNIINSVQNEVDFRKAESQRIKKEVSDFKLSVMRLYKAQLELIKDIPAQETEQYESYGEAAAQCAEPAKESKTEHEAEPVAEAAAVSQKEPVEEPQIASQPVAVDKQLTAAKVTEKILTEPEKPEKIQTEPEKPQENPDAQVNEAVPNQWDSQKEDNGGDTDKEPEKPKEHTVKLNLRYNEKTGEYEPIDTQSDDSEEKSGDGIKFGADYNIRTDSFDNENGHRWKRRK